ncbi:OLC1v1002462C2 [Oldenlandia corymbosa var. corymbosa]|uniref:OLC1v1002462C2 n=1 Tax=Oldenlandia corymbosa var. corymbosa TaxID=529605 RepID=A0AAV1D7V1_OLDCO|nr:OLC1v1002462C2 [Oldenlandia corymbosa var. corymbosa]
MVSERGETSGAGFSSADKRSDPMNPQFLPDTPPGVDPYEPAMKKLSIDSIPSKSSSIERDYRTAVVAAMIGAAEAADKLATVMAAAEEDAAFKALLAEANAIRLSAINSRKEKLSSNELADAKEAAAAASREAAAVKAAAAAAKEAAAAKTAAAKEASAAASKEANKASSAKAAIAKKAATVKAAPTKSKSAAKAAAMKAAAAKAAASPEFKSPAVPAAASKSKSGRAAAASAKFKSPAKAAAAAKSKSGRDGRSSLEEENWRKYYEIMHQTQGFGITRAPQDAPILPYKQDDQVKINWIIEKCIEFYNYYIHEQVPYLYLPLLVYLWIDSDLYFHNNKTREARVIYSSLVYCSFLAEIYV